MFALRTEEFEATNTVLGAQLDTIHAHLATAKSKSKALEERVDKMDNRI
jgi:chaperonin cofactor prefoldin